jgi:hypothetical protein
LKYTFRKLLGLKNQKDQHFSDLIVEQKETLKNRANQLIKVSIFLYHSELFLSKFFHIKLWS